MMFSESLSARPQSRRLGPPLAIIAKRLRRFRIGRIADARAHSAARRKKARWQRRNLVPPSRRRAAFVFGCQRSGTGMLMETLDRSMRTWVYPEHIDSPAFTGYRLKSDKRIRRLLGKSPAECVVFKPICDSQWADELLDIHGPAKALWIFRDYRDVANSAVAVWGAGQAGIIRDLLEGRSIGWRGERVSVSALEAVSAVWRSDIRPAEGGALFWYLRNRLLFDLALGRDPRVQVVRYEELVRDPISAFSGVFAHLDLAFREELVSSVHDRSVGRRATPMLSADIQALCEGLLDRLVSLT